MFCLKFPKFNGRRRFVSPSVRLVFNYRKHY